MLNDEMKKLIGDHSAGMVATINDDGTPSVSPKATLVILRDTEIAFGNIRSPGSPANSPLSKFALLMSSCAKRYASQARPESCVKPTQVQILWLRSKRAGLLICHLCPPLSSST